MKKIIHMNIEIDTDDIYDEFDSVDQLLEALKDDVEDTLGDFTIDCKITVRVE